MTFAGRDGVSARALESVLLGGSREKALSDSGVCSERLTIVKTLIRVLKIAFLIQKTTFALTRIVLLMTIAWLSTSLVTEKVGCTKNIVNVTS